jgi:hypothetical protein
MSKKSIIVLIYHRRELQDLIKRIVCWNTISNLVQ